ncbi:MAG: amino acid ABC transporter substrate-binding protein [Hyphomicrobiaceae bacterium]
MISRLVLLGALFMSVTAGTAGASEMLSILYLGRQHDPAYLTRRAYTGLSLRDVKRPVAGARLAIRATRVLARAIGVRFELEERLLSGKADLTVGLAEAIAEPGRIIIADLNRDELLRLVDHTKNRDDILIFNARHRDNDLREEQCAPQLFHTIPSHAMLADALAQFLVVKNWSRILSLVGEQQTDQILEKAFARSADKFGLRIIATKPFVLSNDPRQRDRSNIILLSSGLSYDAVFLADSLGEVGRYASYGFSLPRPVVGSEGLRPLAWHWTLERYGAPQLNQRFIRRIKRRMAAPDWASWAAVRSIVEAVRQFKTTRVKDIRSRLVDDAFQLDLYKGFPGSYRRWSRQLRQPIALATHNAVIALAPITGFEHKLNVLDTLGRDAAESACPH